MRFGTPLGLAALLAVPLLFLAMRRGDAAVRRRLDRLIAPRLRATLVDPVSAVGRGLQRGFFLVAIACFAIALARPQWGTMDRPAVRHGRDILIAVDTSKSMLANDVSPNRLTRAKLAAEDLIRSLSNDRVGLIAFAGEADLQAPLTADQTTLRATLGQFDTATVERGGTDFAAAIRAATLAFGKAEQGYRALVLISDGEDHEGGPGPAAQEAAKLGIRIFTLGVGTPEGSTILLPSGMPLRDRSGALVVSRLEEQTLRQVADETGGFYTRLDAAGLRRILGEGLGRITQRRGGEHAFTLPIERYQWPLALGLTFLLLAALTSTRRATALPAATVLTGRKLPAVSASVAGLLLANLLTGRAATPLEWYQRGNFEQAYEAFQEELQRRPDDPVLNYNAAEASYRLGKYDQAFEGYAKAMNSPDLTLRHHAYYNAGNTLFKQGDGQEDAVGRLTKYYDAQYQYEQALELDPSDAATRKNLELLKRRINETEEQKKQEQKDKKASRPRRNGQKGSGSQPSHGRPDNPNANGGQPPPNAPPDDNGSDGDDDADNASGNEPSAEDTPGQPKQGDLRERAQGADEHGAAPRPDETSSGRMSAEEARGLLDSLQGDEDRVDLNHRYHDRPVLKDW
ncbi:MAG TPA: VWA domain-containing protein [Chthoniobacterales bacterium]